MNTDLDMLVAAMIAMTSGYNPFSDIPERVIEFALFESGGGLVRRIGLAALAALGGLIVIGSAASLFVKPTPEPVVSEAERMKREQFLRDQTTEELGRRAVLAQLRDPSSARFGESFGRLKHGKRVACGFVNAKNGFGGYMGETPWVIVVEEGVVMIRAPQDRSKFDKVWNRYCTGDADTEQFAARPE